MNVEGKKERTRMVMRRKVVQGEIVVLGPLLRI